MIQKLVPSEHVRDAHFLIGRTLACVMSLVWFSTGLVAQNQGGVKSSASGSTMRVTHVLGLDAVPSNANGNLSVQGEALQFQKGDGATAQISIASIQEVVVGEEDKQVGGTPMALGRAATPFGGGRVIGLFSHKKYDTLTVEYLDPNGGFHGVIFQLNKGQGQVLRNELVAEGARVTPLADQDTKQSTPEIKNDNK